MQVVLVMFRSDGERRSFSITRDITVIGRREDCDLRIPLGEVSRKHCRLVRDEDTMKLEDLGSANGTYLNGQRVQESLLAPGDTIQIGPVVFVIQLDGVPADDELHPVLMDTAPPAAAAAGSVAGGDLEELTDLDARPARPAAPPSPADTGDDINIDELEPLGEGDLGPADFEDLGQSPQAGGASGLDLDVDTEQEKSR